MGEISQLNDFTKYRIELHLLLELNSCFYMTFPCQYRWYYDIIAARQTISSDSSGDARQVA